MVRRHLTGATPRPEAFLFLKECGLPSIRPVSWQISRSHLQFPDGLVVLPGLCKGELQLSGLADKAVTT